jgi:hypothetical protein
MVCLRDPQSRAVRQAGPSQPKTRCDTCTTWLAEYWRIGSQPNALSRQTRRNRWASRPPWADTPPDRVSIGPSAGHMASENSYRPLTCVSKSINPMSLSSRSRTYARGRNPHPRQGGQVVAMNCGPGQRRLRTSRPPCGGQRNHPKRLKYLPLIISLYLSTRLACPSRSRRSRQN